MSPTKGAQPRYFARIEREGPWWCVSFRDLPGCLTSGRGRAEALRMAADALATWCAGIPPLRLPRPTGPAAGEVLVTARFNRPPHPLPPACGTRFLAPLAARWLNKDGDWR
ncbi:type II toxin-antitoxin system HicB family antitoxin [Xanthobacter dioxanivorans]|uniref:Type II toxin-antitoxin system HicB family antitoxin n=1 Tax=Xanthobacter dioxanivorans TaxID=2528964 RepID=A0A974SH52_9HYPH|nr:type II toxin-antitoxin system HicB family antitoxin [Xanthobacter dioxanivorans]QRG05921.1 type II toxin-antitoxin system HicB family antitoxin [Xanthobacter dioxanivorans]